MGTLLGWWAAHPWVVWWVTLVLFAPPDPTPVHPALRWIAAALWCASLVQGLRVTARRSVIKAGSRPTRAAAWGTVSMAV